MLVFKKIFNLFFGPKFKVGDKIIKRGLEPWMENLPIEILEVGYSNYRVSFPYRYGNKIESHNTTISFNKEWLYKKDNK